MQSGQWHFNLSTTKFLLSYENSIDIDIESIPIFDSYLYWCGDSIISLVVPVSGGDSGGDMVTVGPTWPRTTALQGGDPSSVPKRWQNSYTTWEAGALVAFEDFQTSPLPHENVIFLWATELDVIEPKRVLVCMTIHDLLAYYCLIFDWLCMGRHVLIHLKVFLKTTYIAEPRGGKRLRRARHANFRALKWKELQAQHKLCQHILSSCPPSQINILNMFSYFFLFNRRKLKFQLESRNWKEDWKILLLRHFKTEFFLFFCFFSLIRSHLRCFFVYLFIVFPFLRENRLVKLWTAWCTVVWVFWPVAFSSPGNPKRHRWVTRVTTGTERHSFVSVRSSRRRDQDASASPMPWRAWQRRRSVLATKAQESRREQKGSTESIDEYWWVLNMEYMEWNAWKRRR